MIERATGLILRVRPLTETSVIVLWLTEELGRISTIAKGARRPKSPFRGQLDLFYLADFSFQRSRSSDLHALREVKLKQTHEKLRHDINLLKQASLAAACIEKMTEVETPLRNVFHLMLEFLSFLQTSPAQSKTVFIFQMKLLHELGLQPDLAAVKISAGSRQILKNFLEREWAALAALRLSEIQSAEIHQFLRAFWRTTIGLDAAF